MPPGQHEWELQIIYLFAVLRTMKRKSGPSFAPSPFMNMIVVSSASPLLYPSIYLLHLNNYMHWSITWYTSRACKLYLICGFNDETGMSKILQIHMDASVRCWMPVGMDEALCFTTWQYKWSLACESQSTVHETLVLYDSYFMAFIGMPYWTWQWLSLMSTIFIILTLWSNFYTYLILV